MPILAAALLLQPVLSEAGPLRVVAVGTGDDPVQWSLDGVDVATTTDGQAARIDASAGRHELWARSASDGHWRALARPEASPPGGAQVVTAWTAVHEPETTHQAPSWLLPVGAVAGSAAVLVRPFKRRKTNAALRSLLQSWSRRQRP
jgi:hypothetical protein